MNSKEYETEAEYMVSKNHGRNMPIESKMIESLINDLKELRSAVKDLTGKLWLI